MTERDRPDGAQATAPKAAMRSGTTPSSRGRRFGLADLLAATLLFVVSATVYSSTSTRFLELRDEGHILELSRSMVLGSMPHRDTSDIYGPGVYLATAAALEAGDNRIMAVRRMLATIRAGAVVAAYLVARSVMPLPFALAAGIASLVYWGRISWNLNVPYASVFTIPLCLLSCLLLMEALRRDRRRWHFATGLVAGLAILFKQSLGIMNVYGLGMALWAAASLRDTRRGVSRTWLAATTIGLGAAGAAAGLLPFLQYLHLRDYVVHFAPMHALIALVAVAALRRGEAPDLRRLFLREVLPFAIGVLLLPALVVAVYAQWGAVDRLYYEMFVLPTKFQNYYAAVTTPPRAVWLTVLAVAGACSAGLFVAGRRPLPAAVAAGASAAALLGAWWKLGSAGFAAWDSAFWLGALDMFGGVHLLVLGSAAAVAAAPAILSRAPADRDARTATVLVVAMILLQQGFAFTIFPSAGYNVFLIQGAMTPLLGFVLWRWQRATAGASSSWPRRVACGALLLVLPVGMTGRILWTTASALHDDADRTPVALPVAEGITLGAEQRRDLHISEFVELVDYLRRETSPETRLLPILNEKMILFASDRRHALPQHEFYLFIAGWGLMKGEEAEPAGLEPAVAQLARATGEVLVIDRDDFSSTNVRRYFPELVAYVDSHFELARSFGGYRVLRRKAAKPQA